MVYDNVGYSFIKKDGNWSKLTEKYPHESRVSWGGNGRVFGRDFSNETVTQYRQDLRESMGALKAH